MYALVGGDVSWNMALECSALPKLTGGEEAEGEGGESGCCCCLCKGRTWVEICLSKGAYENGT